MPVQRWRLHWHFTVGRLPPRGLAGAENGFAVGDVRVTKHAADVDTARTLWRESEAAAAPYLNDTQFVFERI